MINQKDHPAGWYQLLDELSDAHEHLGHLIKELQEDPEYDDSNLRIDLGHVLAHLNRAWLCRNEPDGLSEEKWSQARDFPDDLEPIA